MKLDGTKDLGKSLYMSAACVHLTVLLEPKLGLGWPYYQGYLDTRCHRDYLRLVGVRAHKLFALQKVKFSDNNLK